MSTPFTKLFFILVLALASCKTVEGEFKPEKVKNKKTEELVIALDSLSQKRPEHFFSRISTTFADTNKTVSFKTSLRMTKDSAACALITKAAIPVAQALIRPDSVQISNKLNDCYIRKDLSYFKEAFGVDFGYDDIEELILGLPIGFDTNQRYFQINDPHQYILSSKKKREVRRELKDDNRDRDRERDRERERNRDRYDEENPIIVQYFINGDLSALNKIFIDSPQDTTSITIQYLSRDSISNFLIPHDVQIDIKTPRNNIYIELKYKQTEVNLPEKMEFIIPEEYEECGTKE